MNRPPGAHAPMPGILDGFTIVELGAFYAVPAACAYLADLGARVIKLESPGQGDAMRYSHRWAGGDVPSAAGGTLMFSEINRGKEMVAIDLHASRGREVFRRLLGGADAFVTSFRRVALERFDVWHDQLPYRDLVYVHLSGYGASGEERDDPAFDMAAQARSGLMSLLGREDGPFTFHLAIDQVAGVSVAWSTTLALLGKSAGRPVEPLVECSLLGSALDFLRLPLLVSAAMGTDAAFAGRTEAPVPTLNPYRCADGQWIALCVGIAGDAYWPKLCSALELGDRVAVEFSAASERAARATEVIALLDRRFSERASSAWLESLRQAGFPAAPVRSPTGAFEDPQALANFLHETDFEGYGKLRRMCFPASGGGHAVGMREAIANKAIGVDTMSVLTRLAGLTPDEVMQLESEQVVGLGGAEIAAAGASPAGAVPNASKE